METLNARVEALKVKAREILRMEWICELLEDISNLTISNDNNQKQITEYEKELARAEYKLSILDTNDPEFEIKTKASTEWVNTCKERLAERMEATAKNTERNTLTIEKLNDTIAKIESGEKKVSIDRVYELTRKMISNLAK
jgi:hypothetical protein